MEEQMPASWKPVDPGRGKRARFAEKLRAAVQMTGQPVAEIAAEAGISRATVYAVLAGHRLPNQRLLQAMLAAEPGTRRRHDIPTSLSLPVLLKERDRLALEEQRTSVPPAPPVKVGVVPEHRAFADALNAWVTKYRTSFSYYWPEDDLAEGMSRGWLQRFLEARAIPSEHGLGTLLPREKPRRMSPDQWQACIREHDELQSLAMEARRARRAAQAVARALQSGRG
jgi:hypothetical protein